MTTSSSAPTKGTSPSAAPTRHFSWKYALAYFGSCIAWAAPAQILLGMQLIEARPDDKEGALALLMIIGGAAQVLASFVTGPLSDRSRLSTVSALALRWGKRMPWVIIGMLSCAIALVALSFTPSYVTMVALWAVFQVFMAFVTNNLLTVMVDNYPQESFGTISGILGAAYTLGLVFGTVVATVFDIATSYVVIAILMLLLIGQFLVGAHRIRNTSMAPQELAGFGGAVADAALLDAASEAPADGPTVAARAQYRDYWFVFISRFVIHLANYSSLFYLLYYLRDHVGYGDPETGVLILTVVYALCTVAMTLLGGRLSDKWGKRKVFVLASAGGVSAATFMLTATHSFAVVVVAACVLGLSWGVFTAVDQALINEALPSQENRARDVSIMTLTVGITNMLAGGFAAIALTKFGGYPGLYLACGITCLIGALFVLPVRSSR